MVDIMGKMRGASKALAGKSKVTPDELSTDDVLDDADESNESVEEAGARGRSRKPKTSFKPNKLVVIMASVGAITVAGMAYYQMGDRLFGVNAPYTAKYFAIQKAKEYARQTNSDQGLSTQVTTVETEATKEVQQSPAPTASASKTPQYQTAQQSGYSAQQTIPTRPYPVLDQSKENEYIQKIDRLTEQVSMMQNTIQLQSRQLDALRDSVAENRKSVASVEANVRNVTADTNAIKNSLGNAVAAATEAENGVRVVRRDVDTLLADARATSKELIEAQVRIENSTAAINRLDDKYQQKIEDLSEKVVEATTLLKNKTHIETTPRQITYLNGQSITTPKPNYNVEQLRTYGAKIENNAKVVEDYALVSSVNGRHLIRHSSGTEYWVTIGSSMGNVYGVVQDFMPPSRTSVGYLILSNGYRIYEMDRG